MLLEERAATSQRQRLSNWNEESIKHCLAEVNRHFVYIRSDPRPEAVRELITTLDGDHDGKINKEEFVDGFCQHMKDSFATLDGAEIEQELAREQHSAAVPLMPPAAAAAAAGVAGGDWSEADVEPSTAEQTLRALLEEEEWI